MKRLLALFLVLCLMLSACMPVSNADTTVPDTAGDTTVPDITDPPETTEPPFDIHTMKPIHDRLVYTMTQADIDAFYDLLETAEPIAIAGEDLDEVDRITDELDDKFEFLSDQLQILYVIYCSNQSHEEIKQLYLDTTDILTEAQDAYMKSVRRIYLSDTPAKDMLFEDWTDADIARLLSYTEEVSQLEKRNAQIVVEYRDLPEKSMEKEMIPMYSELVRNNNRIAQIYGYDNYYQYAYENVYQRDYDPKMVQKMRTYVAKHLAPVCDDALEQFNETFYSLKSAQQQSIINLLYEDYDTLNKDFVGLYLQELPEDLRNGMNAMFEDDWAYFAGAQNAYEGAFTTQFYDEPFCYFGPGYASASTLVHELGHFCAAKNVDLNAIPMDLAETHSQGNEWLFMTYLQGQYRPESYAALENYRLYENISMIVICCMVDEFEEKVYSHPNAGNLTAEEYDQLMEEVAEQYGGIKYIDDNVSDIQYYWKVVAMESPVYYISYAVSAVAALNIYTLSQENEAQAREVYRQLTVEANEDEGFLWHISKAGLAGPFDETIYKWLNSRYTN